MVEGRKNVTMGDLFALTVWAVLALVLCFARSGSCQTKDAWVIIVDTSRYWLNYRHATNALAIYQSAKRLGVPDSRIILMVAEDFAENPRNVLQSQLYLDPELKMNVHEDVEIDYVGDEVSVETFVRVLTGRHEGAFVPKSKRLLSTKNSNLLLYITGHGGENYMKFQDAEQIFGEDLNGILVEMRRMERYDNAMIVVDTCKASTFCQHISTPNTGCMASSLRGQNSYSKHSNSQVGNSLVDEMTYYLFSTFSKMEKRGRDQSSNTIRQVFHVLKRKMESSTPFLQSYGTKRNISEMMITEFLG